MALSALPFELPDVFPIAISPKQSEVLGAVRDLTLETGKPPSATAVAERLGVARITAREALMRLEKMGMLRDVPVTVSSGTWKVTPTGSRYLPGEPSDAGEPLSPEPASRE